MQNWAKSVPFLYGCLVTIYLVSLMFTIMHWPYAGKLAFGSLIGLTVVSVADLFVQKKFDIPSIVRTIFLVGWAVSTLIKASVDIPDRMPFRAIALTCLAGWVLMYGYSYMNPKTSKGGMLQKTSDIFFLVAAVLLIVGVIFKVLHWPGAGITLISGVVFGGFWMLYMLFAPEPEDEDDDELIL